MAEPFFDGSDILGLHRGAVSGIISAGLLATHLMFFISVYGVPYFDGLWSNMFVYMADAAMVIILLSILKNKLAVETKELRHTYIIDVIKRKFAEESRLRNEEIIKTTLESTIEGILVIDSSRKVLHANKRFYEMWSIPEEIQSTGDDRKLLQHAIKQLKDPEEFFEMVESLYRCDDTESGLTELLDGRVFERYSCPLRGGGISDGRLWSFRDITESKKIHEELTSQKAYFEQLFENSPSGIVMLDVENRVIKANKGFESMFQYLSTEVQGCFIDDLVVPKDYKREAAGIGASCDRGETVYIETIRQRKDGSEINVSILAYPIILDGEQAGSYMVYSDIGERKRAEATLRESQERYRKLVDIAPYGILVVHRERVVLSNEAAVNLLGLNSVDELYGKPILDYVHFGG